MAFMQMQVRMSHTLCWSVLSSTPLEIGLIEGSLLCHRIILFPSNFATCHAHIHRDPLVVNVGTAFCQ